MVKENLAFGRAFDLTGDQAGHPTMEIANERQMSQVRETYFPRQS
jgi:hypothetical protein